MAITKNKANWREVFDEALLETEALQFLIDYHLDGAAKGITAIVRDKGLGALSEKQVWVFKYQVVDLFLSEPCKRCQLLEPELLIGIWENDGYCSYCCHRMSKD